MNIEELGAIVTGQAVKFAEYCIKAFEEYEAAVSAIEGGDAPTPSYGRLYLDDQGRPTSPPAEAVMALKKRYGLTYPKMAAGVNAKSADRMANYCTGVRKCSPTTWWALVMKYDGVDIEARVKL